MCSFRAIASLSPTKHWAINADWCQHWTAAQFLFPLHLSECWFWFSVHFPFALACPRLSHLFCPLSCSPRVCMPRAVSNLWVCIASARTVTNCFRLVEKKLSNAKIVCSDSQVHKLHNQAAWSKIPYAMCVRRLVFTLLVLSSYCCSSIESQR